LRRCHGKNDHPKNWHVSEESATKKNPATIYNSFQLHKSQASSVSTVLANYCVQEDCQIFKHPKHKFLHNKDLHQLFYTIEKESHPPPTPSSTHALFRFFVYYIIIRDYNIDKKIRKYFLVLPFAIFARATFPILPRKETPNPNI